MSARSSHKLTGRTASLVSARRPAQASRADTDGPGPAAAVTPGRGQLMVCHGDLHVRHLLVTRDGSAAGVIDWGDLCLADPAVDLSIGYFGFAGGPAFVTARRRPAQDPCGR